MFDAIDPAKFGTLIEISALINSNYANATSLLTQILESATRLTEGEASSLILRDRDSGKLRFEIALGPKGRDVQKFLLNPGRGHRRMGRPAWALPHSQRHGYRLPLLFRYLQVHRLSDLFDSGGAHARARRDRGRHRDTQQKAEKILYPGRSSLARDIRRPSRPGDRERPLPREGPGRDPLPARSGPGREGLAQPHRQVAPHPREARPNRAGRKDRFLGPHPRRERRRQGALRRASPPALGEGGQALRPRELRRSCPKACSRASSSAT